MGGGDAEVDTIRTVLDVEERRRPIKVDRVGMGGSMPKSMQSSHPTGGRAVMPVSDGPAYGPADGLAGSRAKAIGMHTHEVDRHFLKQ